MVNALPLQPSKMMGKHYPVHPVLKALLEAARKMHRLSHEEKWDLADLAELAKVNDRDARKRLGKCHNNSVAQSKVGRLILHTKTDTVDYEAFRR